MHYPSATQPNWCRGRRRGRSAWPQCRWATSGHCHKPTNRHKDYARAQHNSPNNNRTGPLRYKTLPAHPFSPHVRYKILPALPFSPHVRYKTLPARPKWLNLAIFLHTGRVLYRCHHQEAEQGEFCTAREAGSGLATTAQHAPCGRHRRNRRARPWCKLRPVGRASTGSQGHRQTNFACNSIGPNFNKPRKRCNSNDANSIFEQATGELHAKLMIDSHR